MQSKHSIKKIIESKKRGTPRIGDTVDTPLGVGNVQHIKHDYKTQKPEKFLVKVDGTTPKHHSPKNVKLVRRGK